MDSLIVEGVGCYGGALLLMTESYRIRHHLDHRQQHHGYCRMSGVVPGWRTLASWFAWWEETRLFEADLLPYTSTVYRQQSGLEPSPGAPPAHHPQDAPDSSPLIRLLGEDDGHQGRLLLGGAVVVALRSHCHRHRAMATTSGRHCWYDD